MILRSFFLALGQIDDRAFFRVLLLGLSLTVVLLIGACAGFLGLIQWLTQDGFGIAWLDNAEWIGDALNWGAVLLFVVLSVFLMVPVASVIASMFLDEVAQAVEAKHYPHLPPARKVPLSEAVRDTLNFLGVLLVANVLALIVYAMLPFAAIFIFWAMNGFLLGREYITLAAMRRMGRDGAKAFRRQHSGRVWLAGVLMAVPLTFPLINLVIPILGAATFTHLFHRLSGTQPRTARG